MACQKLGTQQRPVLVHHGKIGRTRSPRRERSVGSNLRLGRTRTLSLLARLFLVPGRLMLALALALGLRFGPCDLVQVDVAEKRVSAATHLLQQGATQEAQIPLQDPHTATRPERINNTQQHTPPENQR